MRLSGAGWFDAYECRLSDDEFQQFSQLIYTTAGIKLPAVKKPMLAARLCKRLRAVGCPSFNAYLSYVLSPQGQRKEMVALLDAVSTNKTNFFREPNHYEQLVDQVLPDFVRRRRGAVSLRCGSGVPAVPPVKSLTPWPW